LRLQVTELKIAVIVLAIKIEFKPAHIFFPIPFIKIYQKRVSLYANKREMKIVNPLYDKAFKYLMEKDRLAKKVISVILDEEIEDLQLSQQETVVPDEKRQLTLFRLDFKATVKKPDGTKQTVLIELQKSKYITDIQRFRTYLGSNYIKSEIETDTQGMERKVSYPIISIYILG